MYFNGLKLFCMDGRGVGRLGRKLNRFARALVVGD